MAEDTDGSVGSCYEPTIQQPISSDRYVVFVDAGEIADSLSGTLRECFAEADRINANALSEFSAAQEGLEMGDTTQKELIGAEDAAFNATYEQGFQTLYQRNGGSGSVCVGQAPDVRTKDWVSDMVIEHYGDLGESDEQALKRTVETFLELPFDEEHDDFDYAWGENEKGNSGIILEYTGDM